VFRDVPQGYGRVRALEKALSSVKQSSIHVSLGHNDAEKTMSIGIDFSLCVTSLLKPRSRFSK